ncbi:MAG: SRPBCC family protein [Renibacterium salmoninarum]|nr:SRPBCC family protein [Renibacterium sp.]MDN5669485.1 SRPBCC family protein [Renibacterium salmoninarum]
MQKYSFHTVWTLPASPERCWHELVALRSWQLWWPAFQPEQPAGSGPARPGDQIALRVRSPLGYRLRLRLEITGVVPMRRLDVAGSGDLAGVGRADFEAAGSIGQPSTVLRIDWTVATTKAWMNALAPVAAPAFAWAHGKVMADGERRFRRHLDRTG